MIPYGKQSISEEDIRAVVETLRSDFLTQGPVLPRFEKAVANYTGAAYAIGCNSATSALHIACKALEVSPGDRVWTSPISFVASANCAAYCGATIGFVDIDPQTYNMSEEALERKLIEAEKEGNLPKVVIPVHLAGQSCRMERIHELSQTFGFKIIEDASHAIGSTYKKSPVGSCKYSDITVFSFHPVKIITTGEGGMALTNSVELQNRMYRLRSHGVTRSPEEMTHAPDGPWYYQQLELGFNYRLTDIQASLGLSQLKRLDQFVESRNGIAMRYNELLCDQGMTLPYQDPDTTSSYHLYIIRVKQELMGATHREVFERLRARGILVNLHYIPIYRQPFYERAGFKQSDFPESEAYYKEAISLPIFPGLTESQLSTIRDTLIQPLGHQTLF